MEDTYSIKLPLFEGPLDLLLHLIREQKIDIYDIPIALITRQYLEYLEMMKELNLEIAGDFVVMAATLIHIKSRMLLPVEDTLDAEEPEDPRLELVMKLLEYQSFKEAALGLREREEETAQLFHREATPLEEKAETEELLLFDLNIFDLIDAFKRILEKAPPEVRTITREALSIKEKINLIIEALQEKKALRFEQLFEGDVKRPHFIMTFVALLEVIRLGLARAYQEKDFGAVWIIRPDEKLLETFQAGVSRAPSAWRAPSASVSENRRFPSASRPPLPSRQGLPRAFSSGVSRRLPRRPRGL
ncbi:MAG: segregation/condensation protein A [Nitrospirota bacterium]|jgi:segregation and condensation protein A